MRLRSKNSQLDYSEVTPQLLIGVTPNRSQFKLLAQTGVELFINMRVERPYIPKRGKKIWIPSADHKFLPIGARRLLNTVKLSKEIIDKGGKVYVYCRAGRHRSVAMGGAILVAEGMDPDEAIKLIKQKRLAADPDKSHIAGTIRSFALLWERQK